MEIQGPFHFLGSLGDPSPGPLAFGSGMSTLLSPSDKLGARVDPIFLYIRLFHSLFRRFFISFIVLSCRIGVASLVSNK